eukprot:2302982-Pyramimonas_sp.AAC.1
MRSQWIAMMAELRPDQDWDFCQHRTGPLEGNRAGLASVPRAGSHQVRFSVLAGQAADLSARCAEGASPRRVLLAGDAGLPDGARWRRIRHGLHEAHVAAAALRDGRAVRGRRASRRGRRPGAPALGRHQAGAGRS